MPAVKTKEKKSLKVPGIKQKAKALGITSGKMNKLELIHAIQMAEGYSPCFGTSNGQCIYTDCCFLEDCLKIRV